MPLSRITVTVAVEVVRAADARARELDRSRSWVVAEALRQFVSGSSPSVRSGAPAVAREPTPHGVGRARHDDGPVGLGTYRLTQLRADLRLTPEQRVLEAEQAGRVAELAVPRPRVARVVRFDRFEDFLEWKRREDLPR